MNENIACIVPSFVVGALAMLLLLVVLDEPDKSYARGVKDCKQGKENFVITITPEGTDTTYVHP